MGYTGVYRDLTGLGGSKHLECFLGKTGKSTGKEDGKYNGNCDCRWSYEDLGLQKSQGFFLGVPIRGFKGDSLECIFGSPYLQKLPCS